MQETYLGAEIGKLGFGLMRLPMQGESINMSMVNEMVDQFMQAGFTYFDTAYVYHGGESEVVLREAVVKRYPRDRFQTATKLPLHLVNSREDMERLFTESCTRAGLEYFDFYLLHAIGKDSFDRTAKLDVWDFMKDLKASGKVKHIGFSFHDKATVLREILEAYPEVEFVQLQINYADWESDSIQARECYEIAREFGKPVIIMEPVKGGSLAVMAPDIQSYFKSKDPDASIASWAMRFAASLEGVITVLSGMSDMEQMQDNCKTLANFKPLAPEEDAIIDEVMEMLKRIPTVPCTSCKYCVDDCPRKINIPSVINAFNNLTMYNNLQSAKGFYGWATGDGGKASDCIACGVCESRCPQHIKIIETLKNAAEKFD